jgi:TPR repeat protein
MKNHHSLFLLLLCQSPATFGWAQAPASNFLVTNDVNETWASISNRWSAVGPADVQQAAERGEVSAQYFLGQRLLDGVEGVKDPAQSLKWMRLAADHGYAKAQASLGYSYDMGRGVPQDDDQAAKLYRLAADQGNARAQNNLGHLYARGQGVPENDEEAVKWYRKSAEFGDELGESNLGWMYAHGRGVTQDYSIAEQWMLKAAEHGTPRMQFLYARLLENEFDKDGHQAANFPVAAEWYRKAAEQDYPDAQYALGEIYYYGKLGYVYPEAVKWFAKAADHGNAKAVMKLAELYHDNHENFPMNHVESARWYRIAAEKGDPKAQYELGVLLLEGNLPHNPDEAESWLKKSADGGDANAAIKLAGLHKQSGDSVLGQFNRQELDASAANDYGEVLLVLGEAYEAGRGGPPDARSAAGMYLRIFGGMREPDKMEAMNRLVNLYYTGKIKPEKMDRPADYDERGNAFQLYFWTAPKDANALAGIFTSYTRYTSPRAKFQVGEMYYRGDPLPLDKTAAVDWLTKSAQAGSAEAMNRMGELWAAGLNGQPGPREAVSWYRKAANKGLAAAQLNLGHAFAQGEGIEQNSVDALAWLQLAAEQNLPAARKEARQLAAKLSADQLAAAKARAIELSGHITPPSAK